MLVTILPLRKPSNDVVLSSDDPLEPNRRCIKARTGKINDPVKLDLQKAEREAAMLGDDRASSKVKLGKETLAVELWASGKIEATPYGTFARMMNKQKGSDGNGSSVKSATMKSTLKFDHFNYPKDKASMDKEMPRGKRIFPADSDRSRIFGDMPNAEQKTIR